MPAFNLAQAAKLEESPIKKGVMMNLLRNARLMEVMPFQNVDSLQNIAVRWKTLPTVEFRYINGSWTPNNGDFEQVAESVYAMGGEIQMDRIFDKVRNSFISDPRTNLILQKTEAQALNFNDYVVNGDHGTDPLGFEGLKKRVASMPARQSVDMSSDTSVHDPTANAAASRRYLDKFQEAHYRANRGNVNAILLNEGQYLGLERVLRNLQLSGNFLDVTKDSFEREFYTYRGAPLIDVGLKADQTTEIITDTEDPGDGGDDGTSIYFVSFDAEKGLTGIQVGPPEAYDPNNGGELETAPAKLFRMEWWVGLANFGSHGFTRLHSIEAAASWT
jgi:hypothetical protein